MPISHITKMFAVQDAKIAPMTADPPGGTATYGTIIDLPGIKSVGMSFDIENKQLRGDNSLLDENSILTGLSLSVEWAKLSLDIQAALLGGTVTDGGTGTTETATFARLGTNSLAYFKFEAKTPTDGVDTIGGDAHLVVYKCILSGFGSLGFAEEDYQTLSADFRGSPRLADSKWWDFVLNETAAAIA